MEEKPPYEPSALTFPPAQESCERIATLEQMGDAYIASTESMDDDPEYRAQYMCETFGTFVNLWFQMSI